jgi:hypothetical protein
MMTATVSNARAAALAKHGDNNKKEATGLRLVFDVLERDGRLTFHKSFEGACADLCVYRLGCPALGIQLKTTGVDWKQNKTNNKYFFFNQTRGYAGLLMIFVAHGSAPHLAGSWRRGALQGHKGSCGLTATCKEASLP